MYKVPESGVQAKGDYFIHLDLRLRSFHMQLVILMQIISTLLSSG